MQQRNELFMKANLIEKLYCLSFSLKEDLSLKLIKITETFQQAMNFKKVLVVEHTTDGFRIIASSPSLDLDKSNLSENGLLSFNIENSTGINLGQLYIIPNEKCSLSAKQRNIVSAFISQLACLLEDMSKEGAQQSDCMAEEIAKYKHLLNKDKLTGFSKPILF